MNDLANANGEYFSAAKICLDQRTVPPDWRAETGTLLSPQPLATASSDDHARLWGSGTPRVFLSHRSHFKKETKQLKDEFTKRGIASFVAHEDIKPTLKWQKEIERALTSMDVLVALLSNEFSKSAWTNQEVGIALARGVPVITLRVEEDPEGFIEGSQAVNGRNQNAAQWASELIKAFHAHHPLAECLLNGTVARWENAATYSQAISTMDDFEKFDKVPPNLLARIEAAYCKNDQLHGSFVIREKYPIVVKRWKNIV